MNISHQSIENIILKSKIENKVQPWTYSGYYLFDSLWVKINGVWNYLLALFDLELNTIISTEIVDSESSKTIQQFLDQSLRNQHKFIIITDLKKEYRESIDNLHIKQQFCKFHTKQKINREIKNYLKKNQHDLDETNEIQMFKMEIFSILDAKSLKSAKKIRDQLINKRKKLPKIIYKILWKFIIPFFKKLTFHIENQNIPSTNNKIENAFQKIFPKHIKKKMKTKKGVKERFNLKLKYWNINNSKKNYHTSF